MNQKVKQQFNEVVLQGLPDLVWEHVHMKIWDNVQNNVRMQVWDNTEKNVRTYIREQLIYE